MSGSVIFAAPQGTTITMVRSYHCLKRVDLSVWPRVQVTVAETGEGGRVWVRDEIEIYHEMERTRELKELLRDPGKHCKLDITIESGDDAASSSMRFNIKRIMVRPRLCTHDCSDRGRLVLMSRTSS